jgi:hypothetical protein
MRVLLLALSLPSVHSRLHNLFAHKALEKSLHDASTDRCIWDTQEFLGRCMGECFFVASLFEEYQLLCVGAQSKGSKRRRQRAQPHAKLLAVRLA